MQCLKMSTGGATACRMSAGRRVASVHRVASPSLRSTFTSGSTSVAASVAPAHLAKASRSRVVVEAVKRSVGDLSRADLEGKRVFVRADLNVPLDKQLNVTDDTRIRAAVPTLKYLLENGAKVLLTSHLVRVCGGQTWRVGWSLLAFLVTLNVWRSQSSVCVQICLCTPIGIPPHL